MKSIFPTSIDGDLLRLVHLSNSFRTLNGTKPLQVDDVCNAEARIASVTNTDAGKVVKVKGHIYHAGQPVIEVVSAFLYRGRFTDYENTFETTEETDYLVDPPEDAAIGVLQSKEWFEWDDESVRLNTGTALIFRVQSQVTFKNQDLIPRCVRIRRHIIMSSRTSNVTVLLEGASPLSPTTVIHLPRPRVLLTSILLLPMNLIRKFLVTLILSISIPTSRTTHLFLERSLTACGRVQPRGNTLRLS